MPTAEKAAEAATAAICDEPPATVANTDEVAAPARVELRQTWLKTRRWQPPGSGD